MAQAPLPAPAPVFSLALALVLSLSLAGAAQAREIGLRVEPRLKDLGVQASVGAIADKESGPIEAIVFVTYEKAFRGKLYVSGLRKDDTEIARSDFVFVNEAAEAGGHVVFSFDAHTRLDEAATFVLHGMATEETAEESAGEKARSIVRELLE